MLLNVKSTARSVGDDIHVLQPELASPFLDIVREQNVNLVDLFLSELGVECSFNLRCAKCDPDCFAE